MVSITVVTAVSRPFNLPRLHRSLEESLAGGVDVTWMLVSTPRVPDEPIAALRRLATRLRIESAVYTGRATLNGINQKNMALDLIKDGFYYCLDDDNIIHPRLFSRIASAIDRHPEKQVFAFNQQRWDEVGDLKASPDAIMPQKVDNAMFVVGRDAIGLLRYSIKYAGAEDGVFFQSLFLRSPGSFVFLDETLCFYNYLRHFPQG
jgi:hypothetical protein